MRGYDPEKAMADRRSLYAGMIREILDVAGFLEMDPRHVEAYMRVEHRTLDGLSRREFVREVALSARCVVDGGTEAAEACARSFAL